MTVRVEYYPDRYPKPSMSYSLESLMGFSYTHLPKVGPLTLALSVMNLGEYREKC